MTLNLGWATPTSRRELKEKGGQTPVDFDVCDVKNGSTTKRSRRYSTLYAERAASARGRSNAWLVLR
ncbi:MAG: hypothetical protein IJZ10_07005, partial [Thermoguttaceae bacterium]|nr:hypothetical protein [Thermoguttaceae bacterium]